MALSNPGELTPLQQKAILALLSESTVAGAARAAGCWCGRVGQVRTMRVLWEDCA